MEDAAISQRDALRSGGPSPSSEPAFDAIGLFDWCSLALVATAVLALRIYYMRAMPWNSDEPQHMHVVWGWATGRLPYRDVFDNHSPLFSFLMAPLFRMVGERNDIVDAMRWFMVPLFGVSVWCVYKLGQTAFSRRAGLWAAVLAAAFPNWFLKMGEFRTDVLWTTLWLVTLVILVTGRLSAKRLFFAGLVLGATFSVSMKTTLMLLTISAAGLVTCILGRMTAESANAEFSLRKWLPRIAAGLVGLFIVPCGFIDFFVSRGIGKTMYYCVIQHNITGSHGVRQILHHFLDWPSLLIPITVGLGWYLLRLRPAVSGQAERRLFLVCVTGLFCPILEGLWSSVTPQDYMPIWPLYTGALGAAISVIGSLERPRFPKAIFLEGALLAGLAAFEIWRIHLGGFDFDGKGNKLESPARGVPPNWWNIELIKEARDLTVQDELLMDAKGETVYRPRPYWYVLETLTRKRLPGINTEEKPTGSDRLPDDLAKTLVDKRVGVASLSDRIQSAMPASYQFMKENYLPVGTLSVVGRMLGKSVSDGTYDFEIAIPQEYTLVTRAGEIPMGDLDGQPFSGPRMLEAGHHQFRRTNGTGRMAVVLARAIEKGYSPFHVVPVPGLSSPAQ